MNVFYFKNCYRFAVFAFRRLSLPIHFNGYFFCVLPRFYRNSGTPFIQIDDGRYLDGRRAHISKFKVFFGHDDQIYVTVNTAIKGEVRFLRIYRQVVAIIDRYF